MQNGREKKENRGGRREGAGRPKGIKKPYKAVNTSMPAEYADKLQILSEKNNISICQILKDYVNKNWKE